MHHSTSGLSNTLFPDMGRQSPPCCGPLFVSLSAVPYMQAVYHMPTQEEEMPSTSIPLALQSTFYKVNAVIELLHSNTCSPVLLLVVLPREYRHAHVCSRSMHSALATKWHPDKIQIVTWWPVCTKLVMPHKSVASSL